MIISRSIRSVLPAFTNKGSRKANDVQKAIEDLQNSGRLVNFVSGKQTIAFAKAVPNVSEYPKEITECKTVTDFTNKLDEVFAPLNADRDFTPFFLKGTNVLVFSPQHYDIISGDEPVFENRYDLNSQVFTISYLFHSLLKAGEITANDFGGTPRRILPLYQGDKLRGYAVPAEMIEQLELENPETSISEIKSKKSFIGIKPARSKRFPEQRVGFLSPDMFDSYFAPTGELRCDIELSAAREAELAVQNSLKKLNFALQTICRDNQGPGDNIVRLGDDKYRITYGLHDNGENPKWFNSFRV